MFQNIWMYQLRTSALWDQLLHLIDLLLSLIKADRDGNWQLFLASIAGIIPFVKAAGHTNYAQGLPRYLSDMKALPEVAPEVHQEFVTGNFVVKRGSGKFNKDSPDLALEQSANHDAKTLGGITGITMQ